MDEDYQAEAINLDELHEEYPSVNSNNWFRTVIIDFNKLIPGYCFKVEDVSKIKMQIENPLTLIELEGKFTYEDNCWK
jgi:hypothetical protein